MSYPACITLRYVAGWSNTASYVPLAPHHDAPVSVIDRDVTLSRVVQRTKVRVKSVDVRGMHTDAIASITTPEVFDQAGNVLTTASGAGTGVAAVSFTGVRNAGPFSLQIPYLAVNLDTFIEFTAGSMLRAAWDFFLTRGITASWVAPTDGTVVGYDSAISRWKVDGSLNTDIWTGDIDLSGVAVASQSHGTRWLPTLIAPNACVTATHIGGSHPVGNWIRWADNTGTTHQRTVVSRHNLGDDILLVVLDSDLPESVLPFSVPSRATLDAFAPGWGRNHIKHVFGEHEVVGAYIPAYFIRARNSGQTLGGNVLATWVRYLPNGIRSFGELKDHAFYLASAMDPDFEMQLAGPTPAPGLSYRGVYGDSGCAVFTAFGTTPVLLGPFSTYSTMGSIPDLHTQIEAIIGTGSLTEPSGVWPTYSPAQAPSGNPPQSP